jgi:predicted RND superfamily exporter protein
MSQTFVDQALGKITEVQENHAVGVVAFFGALTLAMIPGMARVETIVALENMMPSSSVPVEGFNNLRNEGAGRDSIAVQISAGETGEGIQDVTSERALNYIGNLSERIRAVYGITKVRSPTEAPGMTDDARKTSVITAYSYMGDSGQEMKRIFSEIREEKQYDKPEGLKVQVSGVPAVQQRLSDMVQRDKNVTTAISLLLAFLITLGLFQGSLSSALMPLFVVGLSVIWLYGTMGYIGIPLSTLAGSVAALVIGIGIDYSVHILSTYRLHRRDQSIDQALSEAVGETGLSILATSVTTIGAFLAFLSGMMPEMHRFGLIMSIGIGYSLLFSFMLLPSIFVLEERVMAKIYESMNWRHGL